jgi:hypothetical protein
MRRKQGMGARSSSDARWSGIWCVCAAFGVLGPVSAQAQVYTTIDLGGYIGTRANSINDQGVITGVYGCGGSVVGSYMRAADGTITTFSAFPCSGEQVNETEAASINNGGVITGNTVHGVTGEGFVRNADGSLNLFVASPLFTRPNEMSAVSINNSGSATGWVTLGESRLGFVRSANGSVVTFRAVGSNYTQPSAINDSGVIVGIYGAGLQHGFVRAPDGTTTSFDPPGSTDTFVTGVNSGGAIVGYFKDGNDGGRIHGFVLAVDGTFTSFAPSGSIQTEPESISAAGVITGNYYDGSTWHGFVRASDGTMTAFDFPNSLGTFPLSINSAGAIAGDYWDSQGNSQGFLRTD